MTHDNEEPSAESAGSAMTDDEIAAMATEILDEFLDSGAGIENCWHESLDDVLYVNIAHDAKDISRHRRDIQRTQAICSRVRKRPVIIVVYCNPQYFQDP